MQNDKPTAVVLLMESIDKAMIVVDSVEFEGLRQNRQPD